MQENILNKSFKNPYIELEPAVKQYLMNTNYP